MQWLDQYLGRLSARLAELVVDKVSSSLRASTAFAEGMANRAQGMAQTATLAREDTVTAMTAVLDAEQRLLLALQEARLWARETTELRKMVRMAALAGEQLIRRAAELERIEATILRRIDTRIGKFGEVLRQQDEIDRAERLRLNGEAEKWRLLAMSRIEATLEETPGRVIVDAILGTSSKPLPR